MSNLSDVSRELRIVRIIDDVVQLILNKCLGPDAFSFTLTCKRYHSMQPKYDDPYKMFDVFTLRKKASTYIKLAYHGHADAFRDVDPMHEVYKSAGRGGHLCMWNALDVQNSKYIDNYLYALIKNDHLDTLRQLPVTELKSVAHEWACMSKNIKMVMHVYTIAQPFIPYYVGYEAFRSGCLDIILFWSDKIDFSGSILQAAYESGNTDAIKIAKHYYDDEYSMMLGACQGGQYELLKSLRVKELPVEYFYEAIPKSSMEMIKYVESYVEKNETFQNDAIESAIEADRLDVLLHYTKHEDPSDLLVRACMKGSKKIVKYLLRHVTPTDMHLYASCRHVEVYESCFEKISFQPSM